MEHYIDAMIDEFLRDVLADRLSKCTETQREFFKKVFPRGTYNRDKLVDAIALCDRTIKENTLKAQKGGSGE